MSGSWCSVSESQMEVKMSVLKSYIYYWIGLFFLFLNKIRQSIQGYTNPRDFPITEVKKAIEKVRVEVL